MIGLICDIHMPDNKNSAQAVFLEKALQQMKNDGVSIVINLGDTTASGELGGFEYYIKCTDGFECHNLIGNSDVRNEKTAQKFLKTSTSFKVKCKEKTLYGINTPYAKIEDNDVKLLSSVMDGDVIFLHHSFPGLCEESRNFLTKLAYEREVLIIHAHSHKWLDYTLGKSRVVCIRALDPDKSIGNFPCITYFNAENNSFEEKLFSVSKDIMYDVKKFFGISCVDNERDVEFALKNDVYGIELRCSDSNWEPDYTLIPKIEKWRKKTNGCLSVHMPNLRYKDGKITGVGQWAAAVEYAKNIDADSLTMHPPRAKIHEMKQKEVWDEFLKLYVYAVQNVGESVNIGIENLHMGKGETAEERGFGYTPEEVSEWIDAINTLVKKDGRVGHILDVGHARNNGVFTGEYPISRWYEKMGNKVVSYHIHQVTPNGDVSYNNHQPIENWFGPMISYVSFFYNWEKGVINKAPVFLEVKGSENYQKSIAGFERALHLNLT